ncbi:hypothetical protein [Aeromonas dhakensis]|uniref:hypothetical protein n=1 Tax=Aeromonas dhakensis TaxID=196024 RepID=UPI0011177D41|nr:hypothetical protein [Aeromonas dhakensis]
MITLGGSGDKPKKYPQFKESIDLFDAVPGTRQYTVPDGVTQIRVSVIGPGGNGSGPESNTTGLANSGGGGGYSEKVLSVTPGHVFSYTVGAPSGTSSFGGVISATSGKTPTSTSTGQVCVGGDGVGGDINFSGGSGLGTQYAAGGGAASRFGNGQAAFVVANTSRSHPGGFSMARVLDGWGLGLVFGEYGVSGAKNQMGVGGRWSIDGDITFDRPGVGGGGSTYQTGGPGAVIVEVLA